MKELKKNTIKGEAILLVVAVLWGSCFIFQKKGMDYIGPYTLGAFRFVIGGLALFPVIMLFSKLNKTSAAVAKIAKYKRDTLWRGGILCGVALFFGATFQQVGLVYTTAGKAAFLTSMEIVIVEIIVFFIVKKLCLNSIIGAALSMVGMYLICIKNGFSMQFGDALELIGAIFWGVQILLVDKYAKLVDCMKLSLIQFIIAGCLSTICMFIFEKPDIANIYSCAIPILYLAIIEVSICYTLQIIGQKYVPPVIAAVTLSLESVFAVIFGSIILNEVLTGREVLGMIIMLISFIIIQIPVNNVKTCRTKSPFGRVLK